MPDIVREDWFTELADSYEKDANDGDYSPESRIRYAILSVGARIAELTQEIRRSRG